MSILFPFQAGATTGQAGNMLLITGLIASAVAVAGGKVMLDRSSAQRKANQMAESMKQAKEIPGSAAMIAKALISIPPNVAANKSIEWTTNRLVTSPGNMPLVYPVPYVSGAIGSPAMPATSVSQTVTPPPGANWDTFGVAGTTLAVGGIFASAEVNVYTNDSTRATSQDVNSAISGKAVTGGNATIARTKSVVTYSFRNCTPNGISSATFTGRYCATASIKSPNYASAVKRTLRDQDLSKNPPPKLNEGVAELGLIEAPPAPICGAIGTPGNVKVMPGDAFSLNVNATGVAVGYKVKYGATELLRRDMVSLPWNSPRQEALHTITGIPTDPVKSALGAWIASGTNQATFELVLQGVTSSTSCPFVVTLPGPVSCVPNSFNVRRSGDDLRTCQMSLRKDNGEGTVTGITVGGQSFTGAAAAFSGDLWSGTMPCLQEDALTLPVTLTRNVFGAVSTSACIPSRTVPELEAVCVENSLDGGRDPNNLLRCNITLKRDQKSHSGVTVNTTPAFVSSSAYWQTSQNSDRSWTWEGVISPCPVGRVKVTASLTRGSTTGYCGEKIIDPVEPAKCYGPPTGERNTSDPAQCRLSVKKFPSSGPIKHVTINGTIQPSSGNYPSLGTWGTGDSWTSPWISCPLTATDYNLSLVGLDDAPSACGTYTMPLVSHTLTTSVSGSGFISRSPNATSYNHGSSVILTATPSAGHSFVNWGGACRGTSTTCTVTMDSAKSVVANFVINTYTLTTSVTGIGFISRNPDAATYNHGSSVILTATPSAGHSFVNWSGDCSGTSNTCNLVMDGDKSATAKFDYEGYEDNKCRIGHKFFIQECIKSGGFTPNAWMQPVRVYMGPTVAVCQDVGENPHASLWRALSGPAIAVCSKRPLPRCPTNWRNLGDQLCTLDDVSESGSASFATGNVDLVCPPRRKMFMDNCKSSQPSCSNCIYKNPVIYNRYMPSSQVCSKICQKLPDPLYVVTTGTKTKLPDGRWEVCPWVKENSGSQIGAFCTEDVLPSCGPNWWIRNINTGTDIKCTLEP